MGGMDGKTTLGSLQTRAIPSSFSDRYGRLLFLGRGVSLCHPAHFLALHSLSSLPPRVCRYLIRVLTHRSLSHPLLSSPRRLLGDRPLSFSLSVFTLPSPLTPTFSPSPSLLSLLLTMPHITPRSPPHHARPTVMAARDALGSAHKLAQYTASEPPRSSEAAFNVPREENVHFNRHTVILVRCVKRGECRVRGRERG